MPHTLLLFGALEVVLFTMLWFIRHYGCHVGFHRDRDTSISCHYTYTCEVCGRVRKFNPYMEVG